MVSAAVAAHLLNCAYRDDISTSDTEMMITMVASIMKGLHRRLMPLLDNHHTSSLTYQPCCKCLNQGNKPFNARSSILHNKKTLQLCGNASSCWLKVAIQTSPHPEKHCIISWWLMLSPPCGPSIMNHMNILVVTLKWGYQNCYYVVPNVFGIVDATEKLIMIEVVCEVGKSLETSSNVIL